jgi:hypothetical protein
LFKFVRSKVLEGGVGWATGGKFERSRERPSLLEVEAEEEEREGRGDVAGVGSMVDRTERCLLVRVMSG